MNNKFFVAFIVTTVFATIAIGQPQNATVNTHSIPEGGLGVWKQCTDMNGRVIPQGVHFVPGPDPCTLCVCDNGGPKWCKAVLCAPPECKSFRVGNSCCDFICLDDSSNKGSDAAGDPVVGVDSVDLTESRIKDLLTKFEAEIRSLLIECRAGTVGRNLTPVAGLTVTASTTERNSLSIQRNCGPDNVCISDLRLRVKKSSEYYVMGSRDKIWLEMEVLNNGEDSFDSTLYAQIPKGLGFVKIERLDRRTDVPIECSPPTPTNNNTIKCDIGNPLQTFAKIRFRIFFQPLPLSDVMNSYHFTVSVNSTNAEDIQHSFNNYKTVNMPIRIETKLEVYGSSRPQPIHYNPKLYNNATESISEYDIGPEVTHSYEIKCGGPSSIEEASVVILWPSFTDDDKHFLYLLEQPLVDGPGHCEIVGQVNSMNLKIQGDTRLISTTPFLEGDERKDSGNSQTQGYSSNGVPYRRTYRNYSESTFNEHFRTRRGSSNGGGSSSENSFFGSGSGRSQYPGAGRIEQVLLSSRAKREVSEYEKELVCDEGFKCIQIRCRVGPLTISANTNVFIHLRGRVYADTLKLDKFRGRNMTVKSKLVSRVTTLPYNVNPSFLGYKKLEIVTKIEDLKVSRKRRGNDVVTKTLNISQRYGRPWNDQRLSTRAIIVDDPQSNTSDRGSSSSSSEESLEMSGRKVTTEKPDCKNVTEVPARRSGDLTRRGSSRLERKSLQTQYTSDGATVARRRPNPNALRTRTVDRDSLRTQTESKENDTSNNKLHLLSGRYFQYGDENSWTIWPRLKETGEGATHGEADNQNNYGSSETTTADPNTRIHSSRTTTTSRWVQPAAGPAIPEFRSRGHAHATRSEVRSGGHAARPELRSGFQAPWLELKSGDNVQFGDGISWQIWWSRAGLTRIGTVNGQVMVRIFRSYTEAQLRSNLATGHYEEESDDTDTTQASPVIKANQIKAPPLSKLRVSFESLNGTRTVRSILT